MVIWKLAGTNGRLLLKSHSAYANGKVASTILRVSKCLSLNNDSGGRAYTKLTVLNFQPVESRTLSSILQKTVFGLEQTSLDVASASKKRNSPTSHLPSSGICKSQRIIAPNERNKLVSKSIPRLTLFLEVFSFSAAEGGIRAETGYRTVSLHFHTVESTIEKAGRYSQSFSNRDAVPRILPCGWFGHSSRLFREWSPFFSGGCRRSLGPWPHHKLESFSQRTAKRFLRKKRRAQNQYGTTHCRFYVFISILL